MTGRIDGIWEAPLAAVSVTQDQEFTWFVLRSGFPYLSVGPNNLTDLRVKQGETFKETYTIRVEDR